MVPKLEREMVLESLYGPFGGVDSMVVGLNKLDFSILLLHEIFDRFGCLVVGDVECGFVPLGGEGFEYLFECLHDVIVRSGSDSDRDDKDVVRIVRVSNKK